MKRDYPDEWILLGDSVMDKYEQTILSGILLYYSPDKRELAYRDKPLIKNYKKKVLFFNRVTLREQRHAMISLYSPLKPLK